MKIAISGATGFVGKHLVAFLTENKCDVIIITRDHFALSQTELSQYLANVDGIINLAGSPIIERWSKKNRNKIIDSRVSTTQKLVAAITLMSNKPKFFINASAIGIYNEMGTHNEQSIEYCTGFQYQVVSQWENAANLVQLLHTHLVIIRIGVVLGNNGGMVRQLLPLFKMGLGGTIGSGKSAFSFIHIHDFCAAILFLINHAEIDGVVNFVAPQVSTNKEFTHILASLLHRPAIFIVPIFMLKILYGKASEVITQGRSILPDLLLKSGFRFKYPTINEALNEIVDSQ